MLRDMDLSLELEMDHESNESREVERVVDEVFQHEYIYELKAKCLSGKFINIF